MFKINKNKNLLLIKLRLELYYLSNDLKIVNFGSKLTEEI